MVWLSFTQMHHVYRCYPCEISGAAKKRSPKIKRGEWWGLLGSQVTGLSGGKAGQELKAGTWGRNWGSMEEHCVLACFLGLLSCLFYLQGSTHSGPHPQWAITETLPQILHRPIRWRQFPCWGFLFPGVSRFQLKLSVLDAEGRTQSCVEGVGH